MGADSCFVLSDILASLLPLLSLQAPICLCMYLFQLSAREEESKKQSYGRKDEAAAQV